MITHYTRTQYRQSKPNKPIKVLSVQMFDVKYSKEEIATAFTIDYKNWCCSYKTIANTHCVGREFPMCDDY